MHSFIYLKVAFGYSNIKHSGWSCNWILWFSGLPIRMVSGRYSVRITVVAFSLFFLSYFGQDSKIAQNLNRFGGKIDNVKPLLY